MIQPPRLRARAHQTVLSVLCATLTTLLLAAALPAADATTTGDGAYARAVVAQVNRARAVRGLAPVRVVPCATSLARRRAVSEGRQSGPARPRRTCGERLALGAASTTTHAPRVTVRSWLAGRATRRAVLGPAVTAVGVAVTRTGRGRVQVQLVSLRRPERVRAAQQAGLRGLTAQVFTETNRRRTAHGLPAFRPSRCASRFAQRHSRWMSRTGTFAHASLSALRGECGGSGSAENVALVRSSRPSAAGVVQMWMSSPAHRANLLDPDRTHLGVGAGYARSSRSWYLTLDLLTRR